MTLTCICEDKKISDSNLPSPICTEKLHLSIPRHFLMIFIFINVDEKNIWKQMKSLLLTINYEILKNIGLQIVLIMQLHWLIW